MSGTMKYTHAAAVRGYGPRGQAGPFPVPQKTRSTNSLPIIFPVSCETEHTEARVLAPTVPQHEGTATLTTAPGHPPLCSHPPAAAPSGASSPHHSGLRACCCLALAAFPPLSSFTFSSSFSTHSRHHFLKHAFLIFLAGSHPLLTGPLPSKGPSLGLYRY